MNFRRMLFLFVAALCSGSVAVPQTTIETQQKPPSVVFKDASGTIVTSIPIDRIYRAPVVMVVSRSSNRAYVLNRAGKSKERSLSAVDLNTGRVDRVIKIGVGKLVDLFMSPNGRRLFAYTLSGIPRGSGNLALVEAPHFQKRSGSSSIITAIDTSSNQIISTFDVLHTPGLDLPKAGHLAQHKVIESFVSPIPDGGPLLVRVAGDFHGLRNLPGWNRLALFPIPLTRPPVVIDPGKDMVWYALSENRKFLFVAAEDKQGKSEAVQSVNVENGKTIHRVVDDPAPPFVRHRPLNAFLDGAPPSWAGSKQGVWIRTRIGLRFISETGEIGGEISVPGQERAAATLSLDRTRWFVAVPDTNQHSGTLRVVDLKRSSISSCSLADAPVRLIRLGPGGGLWVMGRHEMRPISEAGELGDRAILLNQPHKTEDGETSATDIFLNGEPGETISLGEDRAAILITSRTGGSVHRIALLNLKQLNVEAVITIMSNSEKAKVVGGRLLENMGEAAVAGFANGLIGGAYGPAAFGTPAAPQLFPVIYLHNPWFFASEALAARPDGRTLYVLNADLHKVLVIDVKTAAVVARIPVDGWVSGIQLAPDAKHLMCAGTGFLREISLESNKTAD
jgi:YVTN family beta-propeller protein